MTYEKQKNNINKKLTAIKNLLAEVEKTIEVAIKKQKEARKKRGQVTQSQLTLPLRTLRRTKQLQRQLSRLQPHQLLKLIKKRTHEYAG